MNKKRLALALALGISINGLVGVTYEVKNGIKVVSALTGENVKLLEGMKIRSLNTKVDIEENGKVSLSFELINGNNRMILNKNNVNNVRVSKIFTHTKFVGRENVDNLGKNISTGNWNTETGKFIFNDEFTQPGIYTGEIEIEYKDGNKEKYELSFRKMIQDTLSFNTDVEIGEIHIKNLALNNGVDDINYNFKKENITLVNKTKGKTSQVKKQLGNDFTFDALDLTTDGGLDLGDKLQLVVKYGENESQTITSDILLVKQEKAEIKDSMFTNEADTAKTVKTDIHNFAKKYYEGTKHRIDITSIANEPNNKLHNVTVGDQTIFNFRQSFASKNGSSIVQDGDYAKGEDINKKNYENYIELTFGPLYSFNNKSRYSIPFATVTYDGNINASQGTLHNTTKIGFIGDYTFTINGQTTTFFDALSGVNPVIKGDGQEKTPLKLMFEDKSGKEVEIEKYNNDFKNLTTDNISEKINIELGENLQHGYSAYEGVFAVDFDEDRRTIENKLEKLYTVVQHIAPPRFNVLSPTAIPNGQADTSPVYVTLLVAADTLDGAYANGRFERISSSEGKIRLQGAKLALSGADISNAKLSVPNATVGVLADESTGNDLVFGIKFNGDVPETVKWNLTVNNSNVTMNGNVNTGKVEAVNISNIRPTNISTSNISDQFEIEAKFGIADLGSVTIDNRDSNIVNLNDFVNGQHTIKYEVKDGINKGIYSAGVMVSKGNFTLGVGATQATSTSVNLTINPTNIVNGSVEKVNEAVVEYRESTQDGKPSNSWTRSNVTFDTKKELKDKTVVSKTVTGLTPGKKYDFRVIYRVKNGSRIEEEVVSVVSNIQLSGSSAGINGTITGTGGSTSSNNNNNNNNNNNSNNSGTITVPVTSNNVSSTADTASITLANNVKFDMSKPGSISNFSYKDKNGKVVKESSSEFSNVTAKYENGKVVVNGLVPGKKYEEIAVNFTDEKGNSKQVIVKNVMTTAPAGSAHEYLANVYTVALGRPGDEAGYHFHLSNLRDRKTTLSNFLLNMLSEKEFAQMYKTPESKIEALYNAIVSRDSDASGKNFWINEYKKMLSVYGSEEATFKAIVERMVNEKEVKKLANKLGVSL